MTDLFQEARDVLGNLKSKLKEKNQDGDGYEDEFDVISTMLLWITEDCMNTEEDLEKKELLMKELKEGANRLRQKYAESEDGSHIVIIEQEDDEGGDKHRGKVTRVLYAKK